MRVLLAAASGAIGVPLIRQLHAAGHERKPMSDLQAIADRVEIEALRGEFTDAAMMRDYDRVASLFTPDGAVRIPDASANDATADTLVPGRTRRPRLRSTLRASWCASVTAVRGWRCDSPAGLAGNEVSCAHPWDWRR